MRSQPNLQRRGQASPHPASPRCVCPQPVPGTPGSGPEVRLQLSPPSPAPRKPARSASGCSCCFSSKDRAGAGVGGPPQCPQPPPGLAEPGPASMAHPDSLFPAPSAEGGCPIQPHLSRPTLIWVRCSPSSLLSPETPRATGQEPPGLSHGAEGQSCGMNGTNGNMQRGLEDRSPAGSRAHRTGLPLLRIPQHLRPRGSAESKATPEGSGAEHPAEHP